jgi:hypothetical protein
LLREREKKNKKTSPAFFLRSLLRRRRLSLRGGVPVVLAPAAADFFDQQPEPLALLLGERGRDLAEELLFDLAVGEALEASRCDPLC